MATSFANLHVAIVSSPGMGHLIPVLLLANRLAAHHHVRVTVLLVTAEASPPETKLVKIPLHQLVQLVELPPVDVSHLVHPSTPIVTAVCIILRSARPLVRSAIAAMEPRPDALFVDLFGSELLPIAAEFNIPKYIYFPCSAWFVALTLHCPLLDKEIEGEYVDQKQPLEIPGCKPVRPEDVVDPMLDRSDQQYLEYVRIGREMALFDGILINSWKDLDPKTLDSFNIPVHPIGPLTKAAEPGNSNAELMAWLDRQPDDSVILVSFGSGGMLSQQQITELAWGLELSQQRFVWVVRPPSANRVDDGFFTQTDASASAQNYLPHGFTTRVKDVGFIVPSWAQQVQVLSHRAVGGFLTHCGWNSTLESITNGVPMIAWPLYAEQRMNAAFLAEEGGVALRVRGAQQGVVGREEIEGVVRGLMEKKEGQCLKDKVKELRRSAAEALDVGGSSHTAMGHLLAAIPSKPITNS